MDIMSSVVGMVVLLAIAFLLSVNEKRISLRTVGAALVLQIAIGGVMLYFPPGKWLVEQAAFDVHKVMSYSDAGSAFIFGSLVGIFGYMLAPLARIMGVDWSDATIAGFFIGS